MKQRKPRKYHKQIAHVVKPDVDHKLFLQQKEYFADLFNTVVFKGNQVIATEDLQDEDSDVSGVVKGSRQWTAIKRSRDVIKKSAYGIHFLLLGIENQTTVDYAMPLRIMGYDYFSYDRLKNEILEKKKTKKLSSQDKLSPVITLVIYYGTSSWSGPISLKEMLVPMPRQIESVVSDYQMNLLQVIDSSKYTFSSPKLQFVFEASRAIMKGDFEEVKTMDDMIDVETYRAILSMVGGENLIEIPQEEEKIMLCQSLQDYAKKHEDIGERRGERRGVKRGVKHGKALGIVRILREMDTDSEFIVKKLMETLDLKEVEARKYLSE